MDAARGLGIVLVVAALAVQIVRIVPGQYEFARQVTADPSRLVERYPELQRSIGLLGRYVGPRGGVGWEELLSRAERIIPESDAVSFLSSNSGSSDARTIYAYYQAAYALYPRSVVATGVRNGATDQFDIALDAHSGASEVRILIGTPPRVLEILFHQHDLIYCAGNDCLYRIGRDLTPRRPPGPELLQDPSFDDASGDAPAHWARQGAPVHDTGGTMARTGRGAVLATTGNGYVQGVRVHEGRPYLLRYFARSDRPGASARLQINWHDASGGLLGPTIDVIPVASDYAPSAMWVLAPPSAAAANVYVATHDDAPVWFDDFSFREGR